MEQTLNELLRTITEDYLENVDKDNPPSPSTIEREILEETNSAITTYNKGPEDPPGSGDFPYPRKGDDRFKKLRKLEPSQLAMILVALHGACRVGTNGVSADKDKERIIHWIKYRH